MSNTSSTGSDCCFIHEVQVSWSTEQRSSLLTCLITHPLFKSVLGQVWLGAARSALVRTTGAKLQDVNTLSTHQQQPKKKRADSAPISARRPPCNSNSRIASAPACQGEPEETRVAQLAAVLFPEAESVVQQSSKASPDSGQENIGLLHDLTSRTSRLPLNRMPLQPISSNCNLSYPARRDQCACSLDSRFLSVSQ